MNRKFWHIFETGRATGDRWVAGPYTTRKRAEEIVLRYMTEVEPRFPRTHETLKSVSQ